MVGKTWMPDADARLRDLWDQGFSTAAIGRELGVTKNSVISRARRIGVEPRANPVTRQPARSRPAPKQVTQIVIETPPPDRSWLNEVVILPVYTPPPPAPVYTGRRCEWLEGKNQPYVRCDRKATRGSWCEDHARRVFIKRETAA